MTGLATTWSPALRDADLMSVMNALYEREINCGLSSFWDNGWSVWIGDDPNGVKAGAEFRPEDVGQIPAWLYDTAVLHYPALGAGES